MIPRKADRLEYQGHEIAVLTIALTFVVLSRTRLAIVTTGPNYKRTLLVM